MTDNFLPRWDGVARFLAAVIPGLAKEFEVVVVGPDNGPLENELYHHVKIPVAKRHVGDFKPARLKYWLVRKEVKKADVVFTQTIGPIGAAGIIAAKRLRKPLACYIHSIETQLVPMAIGPNPFRKWLYPLMRWYVRFLYNKASLIMTPSEWVDDQLSWDGIKRPKRVVRLGVDTKKFSPGTAKTMRARLGIAEDDVVIGQHGRLAREKDLKTLLRGFIRLRAKNKNVKLLVVGDGMSSIKRLLSRQEGVILPGSQDDVTPYLRSMDIFVLSSLTETTCLSALEAMSCCLPIVSTPVGFVKDYIKEGENGYFFPIRDTHELTKKVQFLIDHPTLRHRVGVVARETVVESFNWDQTVSGVLSSLREIYHRR